jgi:predicted membrane-bound spermidine synthase
MLWYFVFFLVSGFCSILYEIVWLRLSIAQFGVTSGLVSIVLSMFMAGLGLGSWGSGRIIRRYGERIRSPLRFYAVAEFMIGVGALIVPFQLLWGRHFLERFSISSPAAYYLVSGFWIALTLVPWCAFMGATIPLGMLAIKRRFQSESHRSFSFLYLANVLGAVAGACVPLLIIEVFGFRGTLKAGAILNGILALTALTISFGRSLAEQASSSAESPSHLDLRAQPAASKRLLSLLFATGLTSMGAEVVWIRQFTPYLSTVVYAFATILGVYLASTFIGSKIYRYWARTHAEPVTWMWGALGLCTLLPLLTASPQFHPHSFYVYSLLRLVLGIAPFSLILGFVTPMLVDRWSGGDSDRAGSAYAVNILGCILGPLVAGFLLLPLISERWVLFVFALPWLALGVNPGWLAISPSAIRQRWQRILSYGLTAAAVLLLLKAQGYEDQFATREVLRDNTATVIATGEGMERRLLVNGIGLTYLTPLTKVMAHLPLASLDHPPQNALVVCFGMGTTFRALMSWDIAVTGVELVPSVPRLFSFYHADAPQILQSPQAHVVVDDGRRYLESTSEQYDVITLDPPPPVEAAGTSLLYSKEFYTIVKERLRPGGILHQWLPRGDAVTQAAVARALKESFPYVRVFHAIDKRGFNFLASSQPIVQRTAHELAERLPAAAAADFIEWGPEHTAENQFALVLSGETSVDEMIAGAPSTPALQDDRPENEYYLLRQRLPQGWSPVILEK